MILDKEYPATHSMSTAWYIVDEDGNVGIMDFDDNGPVPWMAEEDNRFRVPIAYWNAGDQQSFVRYRGTRESTRAVLPVGKNAWRRLTLQD